MNTSLKNLKLQDIKVGFSFYNSVNKLVTIDEENAENVYLSSNYWKSRFIYCKETIYNLLQEGIYSLEYKTKENNYQIY